MKVLTRWLSLKALILNLSLIVLVLLVLIQPGRAEQSNLYPTSPVTKIRDDTYIDEMSTIYNSTAAPSLGDWEVIDSTWMWISGEQDVIIFKALRSGATTFDIIQDTWTLGRYLNYRDPELILRRLNNVMDQDMTYCVEPSTGPCTMTCKWHLGLIGGKQIAVACP